MKTVLFGNPHSDCWKLSIDDVSHREGVIAIKGELQSGFIVALTPMCLTPAILEKFAAELRELDRTLRGVAVLLSKNLQSEIAWKLAANHLGHIICDGRYTANRNAVDFHFETDQTQLAPLLKWIESALERYAQKA